MSWQALARKEFKEHVRPAGKISGMLIASTVVAVLLGAGATVAAGFMTRGLGEALGEGPGLHTLTLISLLAGMVAATFSAVMIPMNLGIDAIAGERERHTLETLLAGPLSDKSILWGKAVAILLVATLVSVFGALAVWATLIVLFAQYGLLWGLLCIPIALLAPLLPTFVMTCFAFVFSTRAKTVKDAGQKMGYVMIPFFMLPGVSVTLGSATPMVALIIGATLGALLVATTIAFPILAFTRFRRDRLMV